MASAPRDHRLDDKRSRQRLEPRKEPYWSKIDRGQLIGYYRPKASATGTWIAKFNTRQAAKGTYRAQRLGSADDHLDANDDDVLSWAQANARARAWFEDMKRAAKGEHERPITVDQAILAYLDDLDARGGVRKEAERTLRKHVAEKLRSRLVRELTAAELSTWKLSLVRKDDDPDEVRASRATANRIVATLRAALNLAHQHRPVEVSTDAAWKVGLKAFPGATGSRNLILSADEIRALLDAIPDRSFRDLCFALASCGARYGELAACRVQDAHLSAAGGARLHIPGGKTGTRTIAIADELRSVLARLVSGRTGADPLFARADGRAWGKSDQTRPMKAAVKAAELDPAVTIYSLRHSWIAAALLAGTEVRIVADHCGTSVAMIEQTYSKFIGRLSGALIRASGPVLTATETNVTPLTRRTPKR